MKPVPDPVTPARRPQVESPSPRRNAAREASGGRVPGSQPSSPATPGRSATPTTRTPSRSPVTPRLTPSRETTATQEDSFTVPVTPVRARKRVRVEPTAEASTDSEDDLPDPERPKTTRGVKEAQIVQANRKKVKLKSKEGMDDDEIAVAKANERNNSFYKQQIKEDQQFKQQMKIVIVEEAEIYKCQKCEKEFIMEDKYRARAHMLSHRAKKSQLPGIKSLNSKKCLQCHQMFSSQEIHKHYQAVHAVYRDVCGECGKEFSTTKLLNQHEKIHNKLQCPFCVRKFARNFNMQEHIKSVHRAKSKEDIKKDLEAVVKWTDGEVELWMEKVENIKEPEVAELIFKKIISVRSFNEALWMKYIKFKDGTDGRAEVTIKLALEMLPWSLALWLLRIRRDPSKETLEQAVAAVGDQWGSSEVWETLLQHEKEAEDYCSVASLYKKVLAVPTPNLEQFKDEALVSMSNSCNEAADREAAEEVIEDLYESTRQKKEKFEEFEHVLVANSKDLSVWKRYVEKVEEVYEGEERQSMDVFNLAFRAIMSCGEQEDLWFWLVERGLQDDFSGACRACPYSVKLHLAWAEQEEEEGRVEEARRILKEITVNNSDVELVMRRVDLEVRHKEVVRATDILENNLEIKVSATVAVKLVKRLAMLLAVNGEAVKAEKLVTDAIAKDESSAELYELKINLLKLNGNHDKIIDVCVNAMKKVSESKKLYFASTNELYCSILGVDISVKKTAESCVKKYSYVGQAGSFPCDHCNKIFLFKYSRERHVICDHEDEQLSCERCFKEVASVFELKQHSKLCAEPLKCECGYSHKRKDQFNKHACK